MLCPDPISTAPSGKGVTFQCFDVEQVGFPGWMVELWRRPLYLLPPYTHPARKGGATVTCLSCDARLHVPSLSVLQQVALRAGWRQVGEPRLGTWTCPNCGGEL